MTVVFQRTASVPGPAHIVHHLFTSNKSIKGNHPGSSSVPMAWECSDHKQHHIQSRFFFKIFAKNRSKLVALCLGTQGLLSQYLMRYCTTAWDHLEQCPEHQFLEDSPKLTQVSSSSSFPVYLHGQRNNHKAQVNPRPLWGFPEMLAMSVGTPKARGVPLPCQWQLEASLAVWGKALLHLQPCSCWPKTRITSTGPLCRGVSAPGAGVGSVSFHPLLLKNFLHFPIKQCWGQKRNQKWTPVPIRIQLYSMAFPPSLPLPYHPQIIVAKAL